MILGTKAGNPCPVIEPFYGEPIDHSWLSRLRLAKLLAMKVQSRSAWYSNTARQLPKSATVIGAGVIGVATAYILCRSGMKVTIIDRNQRPGQGASYSNGGQLSYSYTDALANPALITSLPMLALGLNSGFKLHWNWDADYIRWILSFLKNCRQSKFDDSTLNALKLANRSKRALLELNELHDISFGYRRAGKIHIYETASGFENAKKVLKLKAGLGGPQHVLTAEEAITIEPALATIGPRISGAIYSPEEAVGDAHRFCMEMTALLEREYGAETCFGHSVSRISPGDDRSRIFLDNGIEHTCELTVICTGAEAARTLKPLGIQVPVQPMKGYAFTAPPGISAPSTSITDTDRRLVFSNLDGKIRVAGLADLGDATATLKPDRMQALAKAARQSLPDAADYSKAENFWAGMRPMTPDSIPIIARPRKSLAINVGHGMLGWTMALGSAERLLELFD